MVKNRKIISLAILFFVLLALALIIIFGRLKSRETKSDNRAATTIEVVPIVLKAGERPKFQVTFSTHSVELDFDVEKIVSLTDETGKIIDSSKWTGSGPGGHHRSGELSFEKLETNTKSVTLTFENIAGVPNRVFTWNLPETKPIETAEIKVKPEDAVLGDLTAKVTIIEFGDFQCPFCGRFFKETEPLIRKNYLETGKARFVFKHSALLGKESVDAANASLCAKEQNKFWEYHDKLYQNQMGENQGTFILPVLKRFAGELGLNSRQFDICLDAAKYNAQVRADTTEFTSLGYNSTPTTFINDTVIVGAQPYATFKTVIDEKLTSRP